MRRHIGESDIPVPVVELCRTLAKHGFRAWIVGGCVRDLLRGRRAADWDLATDATPERVQAIFPRVIPTGLKHGTVTVRHRGGSYEVTTLRGEGAYSDGRRPDQVTFVTDIHEDLARRDFTINALAYDPVSQQLEDPFGGLDDLEQRQIRAVGDPSRRFNEDGLRVLRAARFCATLQFELDAATESAIRPTLETFRRVSAERVREEWVKALRAERPSRAFDLMHRTGILAVTSPALAALDESLWRCALAAVDRTEEDPCVRLSALLWPLRLDLPGVEAWLTQYRFANSERDRVLRLLAHGLPVGAASWSDLDVRRYARRVGRPFLAEVRAFAESVGTAFLGLEGEQAARALSERLRELVTETTPLTVRELAVGGKELIELLALAPGPQVGQLLEVLAERALQTPSLNTREQLIEVARGLISEE